jgi:hypothetical protein
MTDRWPPSMAGVLAYIAVAVAISAEAAMMMWFGSVLDRRLVVVEREVTELRSAAPPAAARLEDAMREIAVIKERFVRMETDIRRIADALERRHGTP